MTLRIHQPARLVRDDGAIELSAKVGDERLWFRVPSDRPAPLRGEPFVAALIAPAMARGVALELDEALPVSREFLDGMDRYMGVMTLWSGFFGHEFTPVSIRATVAPMSPGRDRGVFFSGGVDGLFTMVEADAIVDAGVFVDGVDFQLDNPMADTAARRNAEWLAGRGKRCIRMATNARWVGTRLGVRWNTHNGPCLAGCAHALGLTDAYIASSHAWLDTMPGGSHRVIDRHFSGNGLQVHHHGYGPMRWEKLRRIAAEPGALDLLRVCWQDTGYNCGTCEKCRRTMLILQMLDLPAPTFPAPGDRRTILPGPITCASDRSYQVQLLLLAREQQDRRMIDHLERGLRRWEWRNLVARADQALLGGIVGRARRRFRGTVARTAP